MKKQQINKLLKYCFAAFSCFYFSRSNGQSYFPFENLAADQGLNGDVFETIIQDHLGYMWFGSQTSLVRYDGYTFKSFHNIPGDTTSISCTNIRVMYEDAKHNLWIGTLCGLSRWDFQTNRFYNYIPNPADTAHEANDVWAISEDGNHHLWIGTEAGGLFRMEKIPDEKNSYRFISFKNDPADTTSLSNNTVWSIYFDAHHNGWIGTNDGLNFFDAGQAVNKKIRFRQFRHSDGNSNSPASKIIWKIYPDRHQNIWLLSFEGMLDKIDSNATGRSNHGVIFQHYFPAISAATGHAVDLPHAMMFDSRDRLWIGTEARGIFIFSLHEVLQGRITSSIHYASNPADKTSLPDDLVYMLYEDPQHITWVGTGSGVSKYIPSKKYFDEKNFPIAMNAFYNDSIVDLTEDEAGNIWMTMGRNSLACYDGKQLKNIHVISSRTRKEIFPNERIRCLSFLPQWGLCIGTDSAIFLIDKEQMHKVTQQQANRVVATRALHDANPIPAAKINVLCPDNKGNVMAGANSGMLAFDPVTKKVSTIFFSPKNQNLLDLNFHIAKLVRDLSGVIWFTNDNGLVSWNPLTKQKTVYQHKLSDSTSIPDEITCLLPDEAKAIIWLGTVNGLSALNCETGKSENFTAKNKFPNAFINSLVQDDHGNIWMGTNNGLIKFDRAENKFTRYNAGDGLKSDALEPLVYKNSAGLIYTLSANGIITFFPDSIRGNTTPPPVYLSDFKVFFQSVMDGKNSNLDRQFTLEKSIELPYDSNYFSFDFVALNYINTPNNRFKYFLKGFDKDTIPAGENRTASYTGVPHGNYTLEVWGSNNEGVWNKKAEVIPLVILPPWYETWWFRMMLALAGIGLIVSGNMIYTRYRLREQRLAFEKQQAIDRERSRIAGEMHDDLGSGLAAIRLMSEMAKRKSTPDELKKEIGKISESSTDLIQNMREIIWAMSSKNDKLESLIAYIRKYALEFVEHAGLDCSVKMPEDIIDCDLAGEVRRNIFLVVKESLHNVVKHASASAVDVVMHANDAFVITIHDNGKGIDREKTNRFGNGLKNMSDRMKQVGGTFEILAEGGTTIKLSLPLED